MEGPQAEVRMGCPLWWGMEHVTGFILCPLYLPISQSFVHPASSSNFAPLSLVNDFNRINIKNKEKRRPCFRTMDSASYASGEGVLNQTEGLLSCTVARPGLGGVVSMHLCHQGSQATSEKVGVGEEGENLLS